MENLASKRKSKSNPGWNIYKIKHLPEQKIGSLTLVKYIKGTRGKSIWECLCDCGNIKYVTPPNLTVIKTSRCECPLDTNYKEVNLKYSDYKTSSKQNNKIFEFNRKEFELLIFSNCYYCGKESKIPDINGIDRVNNSLGYTKNNCVSACKICNYSKNTLTKYEFREWLNKIINYQLKKYPEIYFNIEENYE